MADRHPAVEQIEVELDETELLELLWSRIDVGDPEDWFVSETWGGGDFAPGSTVGFRLQRRPEGDPDA